ncbi:Bug family tripartite tricarboxylate transporter substrate binding protein [Aquabacter spiritensis]|uniref:Tripartite-type tricarboxylate transporter receptor subunit TctC n=1 Tax=Aquabacter spiritensis TaxID=933073 RepID=A0A4R3LX60_9HYPH|nr:tripartite tricarboxylate transporter substrate binding protein [Aquabacter spiritensis]TCT05192.1 tripartite-type tricarboxylate transporter receptor subunit TctC [Aquabacter spiritensis]
MRKLLALAGAVALALSGAPAKASDTFTTQPSRILVPFSAGGGLDLVARLMAAQLETMWGQPVVVENKPGAGGIVASRDLVAAKPDGHTMLVVAGGHALNQLIYKDVPYDTLKDFTPISVLVAAGNVILVPKDSPLKTVADVIAEAKKTPGGLQYGTAGNGTTVHLAGELFAREAKVKMEPIHFKGDAGSLTALMGNHIPLSFNSLIGALPQIQKGQVRAIAVTSPKREAALPDVPTVAQSGLPGYEVVNWWGILGPAKIPPAILAKLNADIHAALTDPKSQQRLKALGVSLDLSTPQAFGALIESETKRWKPVVDAAGITAQ